MDHLDDDSLSHDAPSHDAPSHDAPSHDAPSHDAPSHDAPSHDAPSREDTHTLMNEVLPAPTMPQGPFGGATPRRRAMQKMERLLSFAATGAAIGGCSTSGGRTSEPTVDIPATDGGGAVVAVGTNTASPPPKDTGATLPPPEPSIGYAVVDPMPPPATCAGVAPTVKATATWKQDKGRWVVELALGKPGFTGSSYVVGQAPTAYGGKVVNLKVGADAVAMTVEPTAGSTSIGVQVAVQCAPGTSHLDLNLDLSAGPKAGAKLAPSLYDRW